MEKHLDNIAKIIHNFKTEGRFIDAYFGLEGTVARNVSSTLKLLCGSETDNMTIAEVKKSRAKLYEEIRKYLQDNNIAHTLYINPVDTSWGYGGVNIHFRIQKIC